MPLEMSDIQITPVILAGGRGTRLWPLTSKTRPKPFLKLFSRYSLLQKTLERVRGFESPVLVSEAKNRNVLEEQLKKLDISPGRIVYEPCGRNTGPAILTVAALLREQNPLLLIVPSDHLIKDVEGFQNAVQRAAGVHIRGSVTVLGIPPVYPNPHFGYIVPEQCEDMLRKVAQFIEKPDRTEAQRLMIDRRALWHSGMFLVYAQDLCIMAEEVAKDLFCLILDALPEDREGMCIFPDDAKYINIPSISIDYTMLEQLRCCFVRQIDVEWCDVGTWVGLMRAILCLKR